MLKRVKIRRPRKPLGDILLQTGLLDQERLDRALDRQRMQPGRLGTHLLSLGLVSEDDLAKALSIQHRISPFLPTLSTVDPKAIARVPRELAFRRRALPVAWNPSSGVLQVALCDPQNLAAADEIRFATGSRRVAVLVIPETVWERLSARHYDGVREESTQVGDLTFDLAPAQPKAKSVRGGSTVLIGDPDPRRRRALAGLWEAAGHETERPTTAEALAARASKGPWHEVWVQREWALAAPSGSVVYDDPVVAVAALAPARHLAEEARSLAVEAARLALADRFGAAHEAVERIGLLAARQGVSDLDACRLELRSWRAALGDWEVLPEGPPGPGDGVLRTARVFERARQAGADNRQALDAVRRDRTLDPEVVAALIRWVTGADLLDRVAGKPLLLTLFDETSRPDELLAHLERNGWEITAGTGEEDLDEFHAVLARLEPALALLEAREQGADHAGPPLFVMAEATSADAMYALRLGAEDLFAPDTHPDLITTKMERASARTRPDGGQVTGNLRDMSLADMLQILSNGMKTATIRIDSPEGSAEVAVVGGDIVDARSPAHTGEEALYDLVAWAEGTFQIGPGEPERERKIAGSTEGLLMEGFRRLDESLRDEGR